MSRLIARRIDRNSLCHKLISLMLNAARIITFAALCVICSGCSDPAKEDAIRAIVRQAASKLKVDRGFHVVDGQPVYVDSNASEGTITRQIPNVDPATFRILPRIGDERVFYAADAKHVYIAMHYNVTELPDADGKSFQRLEGSYTFGRDKTSVYFLGVAIEGADAKSFTALSNFFAKDANGAYLGTKAIPVADIATWAPLADGMAEDPWYRSHHDTHPRPAAELVATGWSKDVAAVYFGCATVLDAEPSSFVALNKSYGKDGQHVFNCGKLIPGADAASFEVASPAPKSLRSDATDKSRE